MFEQLQNYIIVGVFCEERSRKSFFLGLCEPDGDSYNWRWLCKLRSFFRHAQHHMCWLLSFQYCIICAVMYIVAGPCFLKDNSTFKLLRPQTQQYLFLKNQTIYNTMYLHSPRSIHRLAHKVILILNNNSVHHICSDRVKLNQGSWLNIGLNLRSWQKLAPLQPSISHNTNENKRPKHTVTVQQ